MSTTIRKKTPVTVQVQGYAPAQVTVDQLRVGLRKAQIPSTAVVQVVPGGAWVPAEQVVAECIDFPAKAKGLTVGFAVIPLGLWFLNDSLGAGGIGPLVLLAAGIVGATVIRRTPALHNQSSVSLLKSRTLLIIAAAAIVVGETPELVVAAVGAVRRSHIDAALSSRDPCDVERVAQLLESDGTYEQKNRASTRQPECSAQRYEAGCSQIAAHLDAHALTAEDAAWLKENGRGKDGDVVPRLAKGLVDSGDLSLTSADLGCGGQIFDRMARAVAASPAVWSKGIVPSNGLQGTLARIGLNPGCQLALGQDAEARAASVLRASTTIDMRDAHYLCEFAATLHLQPEPTCVALQRRYAQLEARENAAAEAYAKRRDVQEQAGAAREQAKDARCQNLAEARNRCLDPCMDIDLLDPRADACEARCNARFPTTGCE